MRRSIRLVAVAALVAAGSAEGGSGETVGVVSHQGDADAAAALKGFGEALRRGAGPAPGLIERSVAPGETATAAALAEMRVERVDLIAAFGDAAGLQVRDSLRDLPAVFAAADSSMAQELQRGGSACVAAGPAPDALVAYLRRAAPDLRRLGVYVPGGDEAARIAALAVGPDAAVVESAGDSPAARAARAVSELVPGVRAVWLPPSVSADDAAALAAALERSGTLLVGSRASHFAAGCAVVVRSDPSDVGAFAAVLARAVLAGADPGRMAVRRTRRCILEVNLPAARRLAYRVPPTLLAWADSVVRPWAVKR